MKILAMSLSVVLLGACAHPDNLRVGMSRDELDARFGKPDAVRSEPAGTVRIYSSAPLGERASAAHLDAQGRVVAVEPLLNTEHFAQIQVGAWTKDDMLTHFGRAAEISRTRNYEVWSYRYRESETWYSLFHVMFDAAGVVRQTQNGPDPMFDPTQKNRM